MRIIMTLLSMSALASPALTSEIKLPGQELGVAPHKALYEVKLQTARSGSQIVNIAGHMYYEWQYDCAAWNSKHRFNVLYEYADSPAMRISSDFSNFESFDGSTLNYSALRKQNGKQYEEIRGHARSYTDKKGEATYNEPEGLVQELPENTMFPTAHTLKTIEAIKAGQKFFNATIFDGSDDKGPVEINAFIGAPVKKPAVLQTISDNKALDQELLNGPAQNVQLAFFPLNSDEQGADYEIDLTLHHNSVISDMLIDYGDFSVSQKLIAIEPIDQTETMKSCQ